MTLLRIKKDNPLYEQVPKESSTALIDILHLDDEVIVAYPTICSEFDGLMYQLIPSDTNFGILSVSDEYVERTTTFTTFSELYHFHLNWSDNCPEDSIDSYFRCEEYPIDHIQEGLERIRGFSHAKTDHYFTILTDKENHVALLTYDGDRLIHITVYPSDCTAFF